MSIIEFDTKFEQLTPSLNAFAYTLTKNREDAKDLFQETAFRAVKNQDKFRVGTNFKAWLFTIMKNIFINNYRKKVKQNTFMDTTDNDYHINSGNATVFNDAESNIMTRELHGMISGLDKNIKVPFIMHFNGYKYQEISDYLDLPLGTIKSRIFFARKELKDLVQGRYGSIRA